MRDKVSGAIAIPKASWGCAPALPNRIRLVSLEESYQPQADSEAILPNHTQTVFLREISLRENDFQRPAKGGSTPAFACQRAAIAPLPYSNLQP